MPATCILCLLIHPHTCIHATTSVWPYFLYHIIIFLALHTFRTWDVDFYYLSRKEKEKHQTPNRAGRRVLLPHTVGKAVICMHMLCLPRACKLHVLMYLMAWGNFTASRALHAALPLLHSLTSLPLSLPLYNMYIS